MLYSVVLAGGKSSRMGRDKAFLRLHGQSLIDRALSLLEDLGADRILVSGSVEGYDCVPDLLPRCGPPGGLYSTLDFIAREHGLDGSPLLCIPVDMPLLEVEVLARLVVSLCEARAVHYEGEVFPCVFRATVELHAYLRESFREGTELGGKRSMKGLFAYLDSRAIQKGEFPDTLFKNVNYPEEWQELASAGSRIEQPGK